MRGGTLKVDGREVPIERIQLEQDTGKSFHFNAHTLVDLNRAGVPLMEIVSAPVMRTEKEASAFVKSMQNLLQHIGSADANMEDGSLRADINISVHQGELRSHRVEVKNLNSTRSIERAVLFEQTRLEEFLSSDAHPASETRTFDVKSGVTIGMRGKETKVDYRFLREPDIPPIYIPLEYIEHVRRSIKELPDDIRKRLATQYSLRDTEIDIFLSSSSLLCFFEQMMALEPSLDGGLCAKVMCNSLLHATRKSGYDDPGELVSKPQFAQVLLQFQDGAISNQKLKDLIEGKLVKGIDVKAEDFDSTSSSSLIESVCLKVLSDHPNEVEKYHQGRTTVFNFLIGKAFGQVKREGIEMKQVIAVMSDLLSKQK